MKIAKALALSMAMSLGPTVALAGGDVIGKWTAVVERNGLPQPIFLRVKTLNPGDGYAAVMEFTQPRSCLHNFEYGGEMKDNHVFYPNNGSCLSGEKVILRLKLTPDANVYYEFATMQGKIVESAVLKRTQ